ncbi:unnamed protein product [Thelazia callipaeda]|uniref:Zinc transporter ZIP3 n=1 Tax=Thelazia callipaeda TaxID=103827 RepID=A0A0N5CL32_THECL|nr:unnamed protein product [Thelazia callipaeda]
MSEFTMQIVLAVAMFITTAIAGFAPLKLIKMITSNGAINRKASVIVSVMSCYAGGIFLATCFLDTLPHLRLILQFSLPQFLVCIGILLVYILEEVFAQILRKTNNKEVNGADSEECQSRRSNSMVSSGIVQSITFTIAMSFHSVLEGVALGVQDEKIGIITLFISLLLHKGIEAFSVGLQISRTISNKTKMVIATIIIYSLMTPLGSITGLLLQNIDMDECWRQGTIMVLEALAIGTFIFVTFLEVRTCWLSEKMY